MAVEIIKAEGGVAIENFVNIVTELGSLALQPPSLASVAYIRKNNLINRPVKIYAHPTLSSIKDIFGVSDLFYKMGLAASSQSPSIFTRGGTIYTVEYNTNSSNPANNPSIIGGEIVSTTDINSLKLLTSSTLHIKITFEDGFIEEYKIVVDDLSSITNVSSLITKLNDATVFFVEEGQPDVEFEGVDFIFSQVAVGSDSKIKVSYDANEYKTLSIVDNTSTGDLLRGLHFDLGYQSIQGNPSFAGVADAEACLIDLLDKVQLCKNIIFAENLSDSDREKITLQCEANEILNFEAYNSVLSAQAKKNVSLSRYWTRMFFVDSLTSDNTFKTLSGYQSRLWGIDLTARSQTMNLKKIAGVDPIPVTDTLYKELINSGLNIFTYIKAGGTGVGLSSKNDFDDNLQNLLYIKQQLKYNLLQLLVDVDKITFDSEGLTLVENVIRNTAVRFVDSKILGTGLEWTEPKLPTYTSVEQFRKDIRNQGFHISLKPASKYTQAERETRKAVGEIFLKLGGAVHSIDLTALIER